MWLDSCQTDPCKCNAAPLPAWAQHPDEGPLCEFDGVRAEAEKVNAMDQYSREQPTSENCDDLSPAAESDSAHHGTSVIVRTFRIMIDEMR